MAYTAPTITDRIAVGDNKFSVEILPDGRYVLTPAPDSVTEAGTDINKALLQPIANTLAAHDTDLGTVESTLAEFNTEIYTNIPQDIINAIAATKTAMQVINLTSASYVGGKYTLDLPYARCAIVIINGADNVARSGYCYGIVDRDNNIFAGISKTTGGDTYGETPTIKIGAVLMQYYDSGTHDTVTISGGDITVAWMGYTNFQIAYMQI